MAVLNHCSVYLTETAKPRLSARSVQAGIGARHDSNRGLRNDEISASKTPGATPTFRRFLSFYWQHQARFTRVAGSARSHKPEASNQRFLTATVDGVLVGSPNPERSALTFHP